MQLATANRVNHRKNHEAKKRFFDLQMVSIKKFLRGQRYIE